MRIWSKTIELIIKGRLQIPHLDKSCGIMPISKESIRADSNNSHQESPKDMFVIVLVL